MAAEAADQVAAWPAGGASADAPVEDLRSVVAVVVVRTGSHPAVRCCAPAAVLAAVESQTHRPGRVVVAEVRTGATAKPSPPGPSPLARPHLQHPHLQHPHLQHPQPLPSQPLPSQPLPSQPPDPSPPASPAGPGRGDLVVVDGPATYGSAVAAALAQLPRLTSDGFVWLLRDDVVPAADALERLVSYAGLDPSAAVFGTKTVDAAAVVVEAGVSVDAAGRRVTGVVPGERDRGRHDAVRDVLAVGLPGVLVRGRAWTALDGLDVELAAAADVEFGWRACAAGMRVVVVPPATATVSRQGPVDGHDDRFRIEALRLRLGYVAAWRLPVAWLAVVLAGGRRAAGELLRGRLGAAATELRVAYEVGFRPASLYRARRRFAAVREVPRHALAPLFPSRFGGWDGECRPLGRVASHRRDAVLTQVDDVQRHGTNRPIWMAVAMLFGLGLLAGALLPGPGLAAHTWVLPWPSSPRPLWTAVGAGWQSASGGLGGAGAAPAWLVVMALAGTLTGGSPGLAADLLLLAGPPLAAVACYTAMARAAVLTSALASRRVVLLAASCCYALSPAMVFAVHRGRIDLVICLVVVPAAVAAAGRVLGHTSRTRPAAGESRTLRRAHGRLARWAPTARLALALVAVVAGAPVLWFVAISALVASVATLVAPPRRWSRYGHVAAACAAATLPLWPSWRAVIADPTMLLDGGELLTWLPWSGAAVSAASVGAGRGGVEIVAVVAVGLPLGVATLVGVMASRSRPVATAGCLLFSAAAATALAVWLAVDPAAATGARAATAGAATAGLLLAAAVAVDRLPAALRGRGFGWRQPAAAVLAVSFAAAPLVAAVLFGSAAGWAATSATTAVDGELARLGPLARGCPAGGRLLVLSAVASPTGLSNAGPPNAGPPTTAPSNAGAGWGGATAVGYTLTSASGPSFGESVGRPSLAARRFLAETVRDLYAGGGRFQAGLSVLGVCAVVVPGSAVPDSAVLEYSGSEALVAALDAAPGLVRYYYRPGLLTWRPAGDRPASATVVLAGRDAQAALGSPVSGTAPGTAPGTADAGDGGPAATLPAEVPAGSAVARTGPVPAGGPGRLLVLAEPAGRAWRATMNGASLPAVTAWGWAQAFQLPAEGGELRVELDHGEHRRLVTGQAVVLAILAVLAFGATESARAAGGRRRDYHGAEGSRRGQGAMGR